MSGSPVPVLLVEDDDALRAATAEALTLEGFAVEALADGASALRRIDPDFPGVVVSDVRMPGIDGIELFARLRALDPEQQVIFTTAHGDVALAVEAMKNGAFDFFTKPYSLDRLANAIAQAGQKRALVLENRRLREAVHSRRQPHLIGSSPAAERLRRLVGEVARTGIDLLVEGPPGSGKSFLAQQIHDLSERADRPLVLLDPAVFASPEADLILFGRDPAAALSRSGMIERANGGTLVIDDLARIPGRARTQLASLLDSRSFLPLGGARPRKVDIRVIAIRTTGSEAGERREGDDGGDAGELLHRLGGVTVTAPALAQRREDIPELFRHFVRDFEAELGLTAEQLGEHEWQRLLTHDWPGNLRELRGFARNFVIGLTRIAQPEVLPDSRRSLRHMVAEFERALIADELRRAAGRTELVRQTLDLPRKTLYDKLARYDLRPRDFRHPSR